MFEIVAINYFLIFHHTINLLLTKLTKDCECLPSFFQGPCCVHSVLSRHWGNILPVLPCTLLIRCMYFTSPHIKKYPAPHKVLLKCNNNCNNNDMNTILFVLTLSAMVISAAFSRSNFTATLFPLSAASLTGVFPHCNKRTLQLAV